MSKIFKKTASIILAAVLAALPLLSDISPAYAAEVEDSSTVSENALDQDEQSPIEEKNELGELKYISDSSAVEEVAEDKALNAVIGNDYPWPYFTDWYIDANGTQWYRGNEDQYDHWGFYKGQCTSFVTWRLREVNGISDFNNKWGNTTWGDASNWGYAARSINLTVDDNPAVGSVAWGGGHVAWVAAVQGNDVIIEEYNCNCKESGYEWLRYSCRTVPKSSYKYIHIKDIDEPVMKTGYSRAVPDGYYQIVSALNSDYALDIQGYAASNIVDGSNAQLYRNRDNNMDVFYLSYSNGFYKIQHVISEKCLDVAGASKDMKANVQAFNDNLTDAQKWAIQKAKDGGYYYIESRVSGFRLDVAEGIVADETNIWVFNQNNTPAQQWRLVPYPYTTGTHPISNGTYHIVSKTNEQYGMNVAGTSGSFRNVTATSNLTSATQVFDVSYESSTGSYIIKQKGTKYYLEVESAGSKRNIGVGTGDASGNPDGNWKKWNLISYGSGYYGLVSRETGEGVYCNSGNNGNVAVKVSDKANTDQHWKFLRAVDSVSLSKSMATIAKNKTVTLTATVAPSAAANKNVTWSSSDTSVATVSTSGVVTGKKAGTATITVKTADGSSQVLNLV